MNDSKRSKNSNSPANFPPAQIPREILFDRSSSRIRATESLKLLRLVHRMRRNPDATVIIKGNTVGRGDTDFNRVLGQERADAVACELLRLGLPRRRIMSVSVGRKRAYQELTPAERQHRRRAALTVYWGNVTELRYPSLLMELHLGQHGPKRQRPRALGATA
jgi:outer membrane protein OmpA-like peptidoglycan-associated protein